MPGVIDKVMVQAGDSVRAGDPLLVVIAMKMEVQTFHYPKTLNTFQYCSAPNTWHLRLL